jgi:hypothetical protein
MILDATTKLKRSANVTFQVVAEEAILIRLDTGTYFSLNKIGTEFWQMLDGRRTIGQIAAVFADINNAIVQSVIDGLQELADQTAQQFQSDARVLVDDVRAFADKAADKYHVETQVVVGDLLEIAGKMAVDHLVEVVP